MMTKKLKYILCARQPGMCKNLRVDLHAPSESSIRNILSWTPNELCKYLELLEGDFAKAAMFRTYAPLLQEAQVSGSQLESLTAECLQDIGVRIGNSFELCKALRLLSKVYRTKVTGTRLELKVSVVRAQHLPKSGLLPMQPMFSIRLVTESTYQSFRTSIGDRSLNPQWTQGPSNSKVFPLEDLDNMAQVSALMYDMSGNKPRLVGLHMLSEALNHLPSIAHSKRQPHVPHLTSGHHNAL